MPQGIKPSGIHFIYYNDNRKVQEQGNKAYHYGCNTRADACLPLKGRGHN